MMYAVATVLVGGVAAAQTAGLSDSATMQALLTEVRQLRMALERSALVAPRVQITLQRMAVQEQKVARMSQQLDDVRKQIEAEARNRTHINQELTQIEQQISRETDAERRKQLEHRISAMKAEGEDQSGVQQLRAREAEIVSSLQSERGTLNELNDRLNAIDRLLGSLEPTVK
jgi:chromosome segregation ATPase